MKLNNDQEDTRHNLLNNLPGLAHASLLQVIGTILQSIVERRLSEF